MHQTLISFHFLMVLSLPFYPCAPLSLISPFPYVPPLSAQVLLHRDAWLSDIVSDHTSLRVWLRHVLCRFYRVSNTETTELFRIFSQLKTEDLHGPQLWMLNGAQMMLKGEVACKSQGNIGYDSTSLSETEAGACHTAVSAGGHR